MSDNQSHAEAFGHQITQMTEAMMTHDLDGLMDHYDDKLVFVDGVSGDRLTKDGLRDYVHQIWIEQPDFTVRMVARHALNNDLAVMLEASASLPTQVAGESVEVKWVIPVIYTFDPATLRVVREIAFTDEEAYQQTLAELGIA